MTVPKPRSVEDALNEGGDESLHSKADPNPEQARDALSGIEFTGEPAAPAPPSLVAPPPRPKRRTKAELEAEVTRLEQIQKEREAAAAATAPDLIKAMVQPLAVTFKAAGAIMAAWKGDHWNIREEECTMLGEAWSPVVGPLLANHPEAILWASAIAATYAVAYPRIQIDKTLALRKDEEPSTGEVVQ